MAQSPDHEHCWGVILAGGEGSRLRSLTQLISGDDRPKQFCRLWGTSTLLSRTRRRIEKYFPTRRTIFVLARSHERFYREELVDVLSTHMVVQPCNRGTLPVILWTLMRVVRLDPQAVVTFFPSAFLEMIASAALSLHGLFTAVVPEREEEAIQPLYQTISATDFSMQVLASSADRLAVLCLDDVGWSDLGDPHRVMDTLSRNGLESPQLMIRRREVSC